MGLTLLIKTLLAEKTVIVELVESWPRCIIKVLTKVYLYIILASIEYSYFRIPTNLVDFTDIKNTLTDKHKNSQTDKLTNRQTDKQTKY